jgi:hypothetical protein
MSHEILLFAMFSQRRQTKKSKREIGEKIPYITYDTTPTPFLPLKSTVCLEILSHSSGYCVLNDALFDEDGSTLGWQGERQRHDGYTAFREGSTAQFIMNDESGPLPPCYTLLDDGTIEASDSTLDPSAYSYKAWVTPLETFRVNCLRFYQSLTPVHPYMSQTSTSNATINCGLALEVETKINITFVISSGLVVQTMLSPTEPGAWCYTQNEDLFVFDCFTFTAKELFLFSFIDDMTMEYTLYMLFRSMQRSERFYTLSKTVFTMHVDGRIITSQSLTNIPVVNYFYALDGYPWEVRCTTI